MIPGTVQVNDKLCGDYAISDHWSQGDLTSTQQNPSRSNTKQPSASRSAPQSSSITQVL